MRISDWSSDVCSSDLGLAYRRHVARSFWTRPPALVFYITFLAAALWHAPRAIDPLLERFAPPEPAVAMSAEQWWRDGWTRLPAQRRENDPSQRWPLDLQDRKSTRLNSRHYCA